MQLHQVQELLERCLLLVYFLLVCLLSPMNRSSADTNKLLVIFSCLIC